MRLVYWVSHLWYSQAHAYWRWSQSTCLPLLILRTRIITLTLLSGDLRISIIHLRRSIWHAWYLSNATLITITITESSSPQQIRPFEVSHSTGLTFSFIQNQYRKSLQLRIIPRELSASDSVHSQVHLTALFSNDPLPSRYCSRTSTTTA